MIVRAVLQSYKFLVFNGRKISIKNILLVVKISNDPGDTRHEFNLKSLLCGESRYINYSAPHQIRDAVAVDSDGYISYFFRHILNQQQRKYIKKLRKRELKFG